MATSEAGTAEILRQLLVRSDPNVIRLFHGATNLCATRMHFEVTADHLLYRFLDDTSGDVHQILKAFGVNVPGLRRELQRVLQQAPAGHSGKPALAVSLLDVFRASGALADELGGDRIRPGYLLLAMALNPDLLCVCERSGEFDRIDGDQLRDHIHEIVSSAPAESDSQSTAGAAAPDGDALSRFTVDLTDKASRGEIDPVFGRDVEIRRMIDIFSRRRKNNPILVGEPGTGKTAIVEGLALRISADDVPPILKGVRLLSLDLGALQAGAGVKGEFENRLKGVIQEIKGSDTPIVLFIDEAHMLIGAGATAGGGDAANLLKPALARGELRTVAATTWAEYKKYFEKDAALERRFQMVKCDEPSVETTLVMLRGLKEKYEAHHKVIVLDEAIKAAAELSDRYISGRFMPDKAVDLLDTAAGRVAVSLTTKPALLDDIERELADLARAREALERDAESGVPANDGEIEECDRRHPALLERRAELESHWSAQSAIANRLTALRESLLNKSQFDGSSPIADEGEERVEAAAAEKTPSEPGERRRLITEALAELRAIQGELPLVFPQVDAGVVAAVVSDWTGVPVGKVVSDDARSVLQVEERLQSRVVGQAHALKIVGEKLRIAKAGIGNPDQPMGVFLCVGPSGVGKTELALSLADLIFGGDRFITTINMSEFMEKHTVSQLKGSPPGYVGYGEGGVLTEAVRRHPYSVILLDEVEKAHPDVLNLFYQVFDKGMLADGEGRIVSFKNSIIVMTSNLGTDVIQGLCESGEEVNADLLKEAIYPHLREHFKPALVARMTVIPFMTLDGDVLSKIAEIKLKKVAERLAKEHGLVFSAAPEVYAQIASQCSQVDLGARQIDHLLDRSILPEMAKRLLLSLAEGGAIGRLSMALGNDGEFQYAIE